MEEEEEEDEVNCTVYRVVHSAKETLWDIWHFQSQKLNTLKAAFETSWGKCGLKINFSLKHTSISDYYYYFFFFIHVFLLYVPKRKITCVAMY